MAILVCGGAGYIGSHAVHQLIQPRQRTGLLGQGNDRRRREGDGQEDRGRNRRTPCRRPCAAHRFQRQGTPHPRLAAALHRGGRNHCDGMEMAGEASCWVWGVTFWLKCVIGAIMIRECRRFLSRSDIRSTCQTFAFTKNDHGTSLEANCAGVRGRCNR